MCELGAFQQAFGRALFEGPSPMNDGRTAALGAALAVHRNTVTKGLADALAANYPTIAQLVGDEWFKACAIEYVRMHPAGSPILALYGEAFPAFLAAFVPAAELAYLADVARIDRMWIEAYTAPDAAPLTSGSLARLAPSALAEERIALHPAARFRRVCNSAASIWIHHRTRQSSAAVELADRQEGILLTRPQGAVEYQLLDDSALQFLERLRSGATLGAAAEAALRTDVQTDVAGLLAQLLVAGTFAHVPQVHS